MKKIILLMVIVAILTMPANAQMVCELEFTIYKDDAVELNKIQVRPGTASIIPSGTISSDYTLHVLDSNRNIIKEAHLPVSFLVLSNPPQETNRSRIWLEVEYDSSWRFLEIYRGDFRIFFKDLVSLCNEDSICNLQESWISCPQDCSSGSEDGWCDRVRDGTCDPDCAEGVDSDCELGTTTTGTTAPTTISATTSVPVTTAQPTTLPTIIPVTTLEPEKEEGLSGYLLYLLGAIALIAIIFFIYKVLQRSRKGQRSKEDEQKLRTWAEEQLRSGEDPELLKKAIEDQNSDPSMVDEIMKRL